MQNWLIILLVIITAGALVCCSFTVTQLFSPERGENDIKLVSEGQSAYMAEVRARNIGMLVLESRRADVREGVTNKWQAKGR
jgi:hypothetical protein